jgi:hypothetical protein
MNNPNGEKMYEIDCDLIFEIWMYLFFRFNNNGNQCIINMNYLINRFSFFSLCVFCQFVCFISLIIPLKKLNSVIINESSLWIENFYLIPWDKIEVIEKRNALSCGNRSRWLNRKCSINRHVNLSSFYMSYF